MIIYNNYTIDNFQMIFMLGRGSYISNIFEFGTAVPKIWPFFVFGPKWGQNWSDQKKISISYQNYMSSEEARRILHSENLHPDNLHPRTFSSFWRKGHLHPGDICIPSLLHPEDFCIPAFLHPRPFYIPALLHPGPFASRELLHSSPFASRELLHPEEFCIQGTFASRWNFAGWGLLQKSLGYKGPWCRMTGMQKSPGCKRAGMQMSRDAKSLIWKSPWDANVPGM